MPKEKPMTVYGMLRFYLADSDIVAARQHVPEQTTETPIVRQILSLYMELLCAAKFIRISVSCSESIKLTFARSTIFYSSGERVHGKSA